MHASLRSARRLTAPLLLATALSLPSAQAELLTGVITNIPESVQPPTIVGDATYKLVIDWSINTTHRGWFYGNWRYDTWGARAVGIDSPEDVIDPSLFTFNSGTVGGGPFLDAFDNGGVGEFVLFHNRQQDIYGLVRVDNIPRETWALTATWWLQTDGSTNFSAIQTPIPEPGTYAALAGLAVIGWALVRRRRH